VAPTAGRTGTPPTAPGSHRPRRAWRLNLRALLILTALVAVGVPAGWAWKVYRDRRDQSALWRQAEDHRRAHRPDLALKYLDRYLELNARDAEAMDRKAELLAELAQAPEHLLAAAQVCDQVLRLDPDSPARQRTRRRLLELDLRLEAYGPHLVKYQTAEAVADALIGRGARDAQAYYLRGRIREGLATSGREEILDRAVADYEQAHRLAPGDAAAAERLARLYRARLNRPEQADRILDELVGANPSAPTYLTLYQHFAGLGPEPRARAALQEALRLAPTDPAVLLAAARDALRRNAPAEARVHLAALPPAIAADPQVQLLRGAVELQGNRLDGAIDQWRSGLLASGGTEAELTWWLAYVYLQLGRIADAEPLVLQYRRLVGGDAPPPAGRYLEALRDLKTNQTARAIGELELVRHTVAPGLEGQVHFTLAQAYEAVRDEAKAMELYRQAARLSPRWTAPRLAAARLLEDRDPEAAAQELERGLQGTPDDAGLLVGLAQVRWRQQAPKPRDQQDWRGIEQLLEHARRAAPGATAVVLLHADYLVATGRLDEAVTRLGAAARDRGGVEIWTAYVNGLTRQGKADEAVRALDEAGAAVGDGVALRIARARLLSLQGHGQAAGEALVGHLDRLPADQRPAAWAAQAQLTLRRGDTPAARQALDQWALLAPHDPQPRLMLLDLARTANDPEAVHRQVEALKTFGPDNFYWRVGRVYELLAQAQAQAKDPAAAQDLDEAERLTTAILEAAPTQPAGYVLRGLLLEQRGRLDEAIAAYDQAVQRNGGPVAINRLAGLLARRGGPEDRDRLRRLTDSTGQADRFLAETSYQVGDAERARQLAAEVVRGNPGSLELRVWQARLLNSLGAPGEAEEALRSLIRRQPEELGPRLALLVFQVGQGRAAEARATIDQIRVGTHPEHPELVWAQCYRIAGDPVQAETMFREALRKWPDASPVRQGAADFFEVTGRPEEAIAALRPLVEHDPKAAGAARRLAQLLSAKPRDNPSWQEALALVSTGPASGDAPEDRLTRAVVLARGPEPAHRRAAVALLEGLVADLPASAPAVGVARRLLVDLLLADDPPRACAHAAALAAEGARPGPDALALYAEVLLRAGRPEEADRPLRRLAAAEPDGLRLLMLRARLLAARGRRAEASALLEQAIQDRASSAPGKDKDRAEAEGPPLVALLAELGDLDAAERAGRLLAEHRPRVSWAAAGVLARRGRPEEAVALIRAAQEAGAPRAALLRALEQTLAQAPDAARLAPADALLEEARRREPEAIEWLLVTALLRHFQGRFDDEIQLYQAALERHPTDFLFLNNMAWTLSEERPRPDPAEALRRIDEAIRHVGRLPQLLDTRGVILTRLGRLDEAIAELDEATRGPTGALALFHLARAYQQAGRVAEARAARDRAQAAGLDHARLATRERAEWEALARP
jgi:tetratricopeptide (TPR) repeat protein